MARPVATQVDLEFLLPDVAVSPTSIIDVGSALSLMNRKSWRSGYVYSIDYFEYIGLAGDEIFINKLPEGYVTNESWKNCFAVWRRQRADAMDNQDTRSGRWSDFKPWFNIAHRDGDHPQLNPLGKSASGVSDTALSTSGSEWNRAEIIVNDVGAATTTTYDVGMLGPSVINDYGGIIQAWADTRVGTMAPDPLLPGVASTLWITRSGEESSDMSQDVMNLVEQENDNPPYANEPDSANTPIYVGGSESAVGGVSHDSGLVGVTGRAVGLSGGLFPLGMIQITMAGESSPVSRILRLHVTRGKYKGVGALKVGDFS